MTKGQIVAVLICVGIGSALYLLGERTSLTDHNKPLAAPNQAANGVFDAAKLISQATATLSEKDAKQAKLLQKALEKVTTNPDKITANEQLMAFWDAQTRWEISGIYHQNKAELTQNPIDWATAASRYLAAADMMQDPSTQLLIKQKAVASFEKATSIAPNDIDLKADLANAYTICTPDNPMKGVTMLREIVAKDSTNLRANFHLAQLAVRSGQTDKAIARFEKINKLYPAFPDAYLGLGEMYYQQGKLPEAKNILQQYKALVKDPAITQQVDAFLAQMK
jgi:tetratricopeptide (TPR) repeat protein